ncbi:MAG: DUF805 domain-containing protein [Rhodospirillales bacterium]|nr:MAG: DUF805 domain-containing protein [Rhodospirillales bacterium]
MDDLKTLLISYEGRINRGRFWKGILVLFAINIALVIINVAIGYLIGGILSTIIGLLSLLIYIASLWPSIVLGIKRFHDRGKPGIWVLIALVPVIGGLWYLIECGFLEGTKGPNQFGPDPLAGA